MYYFISHVYQAIAIINFFIRVKVQQLTEGLEVAKQQVLCITYMHWYCTGTIEVYQKIKQWCVLAFAPGSSNCFCPGSCMCTCICAYPALRLSTTIGVM